MIAYIERGETNISAKDPSRTSGVRNRDACMTDETVMTETPRPLPANTKHLHNIYTTSAQRLRRWLNIV